MNGISISVTENLELDMPWISKVFLEINCRISKRCFRLCSGLLHLAFELAFRIDDLHSATAAT